MDFDNGSETRTWVSDIVRWAGASAAPSDHRAVSGPMGILAVDRAGVVVDSCVNARTLYGAGPADLHGTPVHQLFVDMSCIEALFARCENGRPPTSEDVQVIELLARRLDGTELPVALVRCVLPGDAAGRAYIVLQDISCARAAAADFARLAGALEHIGDSLAITDVDGKVVYVNRAFEQVTGFARSELIGHSMRRLKSGRHSARFYENLWRTILDGRIFRARFVNKRQNGTLFYEEKTISPMLDEAGHITHFISSGRDVSEQVHAEQQLRFLSHYDALTRLPNREMFLDQLRRTVALAGSSRLRFALLYIDLDRFKVANDTLGHDTGDQLLVQAAVRLKQCIRGTDMVARVAGDEFGLIVNDIRGDRDAIALVTKLRSAFAPAFVAGEHEVFLSFSIGIACFPRDGDSAVALLKHADVAMHEAKSAGRNDHRFYVPSMTENASDNLELETSLRGALQRGEFELHYQPQIDLTRGTVVGVEALLRWRHPERGLVSPASFIPLLEQMGVMGSIGEWILHRAFEDVCTLHAHHPVPINLAVNLSTQQFRDARLLESVETALRRTGLAPARLELEITEGTLMEDVPTTVATLHRLRERGIRIAVDDFGTGYSSLSYLRKFPIDTIKIDRSFVWDAARDAGARTIVRAVVSLGRELDMHVVAEGVETEEQLAVLEGMQCSLIQGFLFSAPLPLLNLREYLMNWTPLRFAEPT